MPLSGGGALVPLPWRSFGLHHLLGLVKVGSVVVVGLIVLLIILGLSVLPQMYTDLWTAAKGMYKLDPVIADGGEVILYAPHITEISYTHGHLLDEIGYHVRDYFTQQWDQFKDYPRAVLAHATHLRGTGSYENRVEHPRIQVTLATGIPRQRCEQVNLGYRDPASIDPESWAGRQDEGLLLVPHAGETLYRIKNQADTSPHDKLT